MTEQNQNKVELDSEKEIEKQQKKFLIDQLALFGVESIPSATGILKLQEMLSAKMQELADLKDSFEITENSMSKKESKQIDDSQKLIRFRLSTHNPEDSRSHGIVVSISNKFMQCKKFIPFNPVFYKNGYHAPKCVYDFLQNCEYSEIKQEADKNGKPYNKIEIKKRFTLEKLPPLTEKEYNALAEKQKFSQNQDD